MVSEAMEFLRTRKKMNLLIVAANIAVFIVLSFMGDIESAGFVLGHGGCYTPAVLNGEYYRLFTAMFIHYGLAHLLYNMLCLMAVGDRLETVWGPVRYLIIYVLGGLAGNGLTVFLEMRSGDYAVGAGASGAVFAVVGAMVVYVQGHREQFSNAMMQRVLVVAVLMLAEGFTQENVNNTAHIGGLVAGLALGGICLLTTRRDRRRF